MPTAREVTRVRVDTLILMCMYNMHILTDDDVQTLLYSLLFFEDIEKNVQNELNSPVFERRGVVYSQDTVNPSPGHPQLQRFLNRSIHPSHILGFKRPDSNSLFMGVYPILEHLRCHLLLRRATG